MGKKGKRASKAGIASANEASQRRELISGAAAYALANDAGDAGGMTIARDSLLKVINSVVARGELGVLRLVFGHDELMTEFSPPAIVSLLDFELRAPRAFVFMTEMLMNEVDMTKLDEIFVHLGGLQHVLDWIMSCEVILSASYSPDQYEAFEDMPSAVLAQGYRALAQCCSKSAITSNCFVHNTLWKRFMHFTVSVLVASKLEKNLSIATNGDLQGAVGLFLQNHTLSICNVKKLLKSNKKAGPGSELLNGVRKLLVSFTDLVARADANCDEIASAGGTLAQLSAMICNGAMMLRQKSSCRLSDQTRFLNPDYGPEWEDALVDAGISHALINLLKADERGILQLEATRVSMHALDLLVTGCQRAAFFGPTTPSEDLLFLLCCGFYHPDSQTRDFAKGIAKMARAVPELAKMLEGRDPGDTTKHIKEFAIARSWINIAEVTAENGFAAERRASPKVAGKKQVLGSVHSILTSGTGAMMSSRLDRAERVCAKCEVGGDATTINYCSSCHLVAYCSKECQKAHWSVHKALCRASRAGK